MPWICQNCQSNNLDLDTVCEVCGSSKPGAVTKDHGGTTCDDCRQPTRATQLTPASPDPANDSAQPRRWRCASCHVEYLRLRALADPISPDDLASCKAKIAESLNRATTKWATLRSPSL